MQTLQQRPTYGNGDVIGLVAVIVPEGMTGKGLLKQRRLEQQREQKATEKKLREIARADKRRKRVAEMQRKAKKKALKNSMTLKQVKKGDFFKLVNFVNGVMSLTKVVYVKGEYCRSQRKFGFYKFDDVNAWRYLPGSRPVSIDFEF